MTFNHRSYNLAARFSVMMLLAFAASSPVQSEERPNDRPGISLPTLAPLVKRVLPSIVTVRAATRLPDTGPMVDPGMGFPDAPAPEYVDVVGSGTIVDAELGLIVTGHHVVENAEAISVSLYDGRQLIAATLTTSREDDLALLKIAPGGLTSLSLGDANDLEIGDFLLLIGNPLGQGQSTTFGIVSALHRSSPGIKNSDLIATDALVERGDSGGPLINVRGEVVGISIAHSNSSESGGFGFAVPANAVRELLARTRPNG